MPILQACAHRIDKQSDEQPATLTCGEAMTDTAIADSLLANFTSSFHGKPKAWGHFSEAGVEGDSEDSEAAPASSSRFAFELERYRSGEIDFTDFTRQTTESLMPLLDAHLSIGGHWWFVHSRQGEAETLTLAMLHQRDGYGFDDDLNLVAVQQLNLGQLMLAARIDLTQWQRGQSRQYITYVQDRGNKKLVEAFREWLGCQEGVNAGAETRTLLKAFSDYVESEDLPEEASREKTEALIDYANGQAKRGDDEPTMELATIKYAAPELLEASVQPLVLRLEIADLEAEQFIYVGVDVGLCTVDGEGANVVAEGSDFAGDGVCFCLGDAQDVGAGSGLVDEFPVVAVDGVVRL